MKKIIIFGVGKVADVVYCTFRDHTEYSVEAFTCHSDYISERILWKLPVVPFEGIERHYPPDEYDMFVAIGYHELNELRARVVADVLGKGYLLVNCISLRANVSSTANVGYNCFVMDGVSIQPCAEIGSNVFLWSNTLVAHHAKIKDHCWLASESVIGGNTIVNQKCFVGLNATIGHEIEIGEKNFLGAGALVLRSTSSKSVLINRETEKLRLDSERFLQITKMQ